MEDFFNAQSVAVAGVSTDPQNLGRIIVHNLRQFLFNGRIYLVGAREGSFLGHRIYTSITAIPDTVDLATLLVPASVVPEMIRQCGEKGIRRVVVQSAGFRELGEHRLGLEEHIRRLLQQYGIRMIGPNCIGIANRRTGLAVPFLPMFPEAPPGRVSIFSQSGGVGAAMINALSAENLGFNKFASIGNKLDVDETDLLEYLIERDETTEVIFGYLEGIAHGRRLMELAYRSPKPIILHKSSRSESGSTMARSHSASLSTDAQVVDAAFRQCGVLQSREHREAMELVKSSLLPVMKGNRLAILSRSGGHAVMAADAAEELGFELPPFPQDILEMVQEHARAKVIQFHNPMDLGDVYHMPAYRLLAEKTLSRDDIDGLVFIHNYQGIVILKESRRLIAELGELSTKMQKPVALCIFTTKAEMDADRRMSRLPIFDDPREAVRALARSRDRQKTPPLPFATEPLSDVDRLRARQELEKAPADFLAPDCLAAILDAYKIPLVPWTKALSEDEALRGARRLGFPVALKTAEPSVVHKSEAGGVHLNIADALELKQAYGRLRELGPSVLIQKMAGSGMEWIVGGRQDLQFGPVLVAGLGGIYVEVLKETGLRIAPIVHEEAARLVAECRGASLLEGVRGQPALDRLALEDLLVRVSWLLKDLPELSELDLNPVRVFPTGCLVLDWRGTKRGKEAGGIAHREGDIAASSVV